MSDNEIESVDFGVKPRDFEEYERLCELRAQGKEIDEIAGIMDRTQATLRKWMKRPDYPDIVRQFRKRLAPDDLLNADRVVRANMAENDLAAAKLVYEREGEIGRNKADVTVNITLTDFIEAEKQPLDPAKEVKQS